MTDRLGEYMALVARHQAAVRSLVARLAPRRDQVDDLAQEVFVVAFESFEKYDPERELLPWLRGIARNLCRAAWRKTRRSELPGGLEEVLAAAAPGEDPAAPRLEALRACVAGLPAEHRKAILLRHERGLDSRRIALELGRSPGAVNAYFLRIRRALRACVERRLKESLA